MNAQSFPKLEPIKPDADWIAPLLKLSLFVSTLGWIVYGVFALAFDDIAVIPARVQSVLVIVGSALIVAGAEMNTAPTVVAVARKWGAGKGQTLDGVAFAASLVGSITAALIAFSIRQVRLGDSNWRVLALDVGPLVVGIVIACDFYAAAVELGLLRSDYDREIEQWIAERAEWNESHGYVEPVVLRPATIEDARRVVGQMNGERAGLTTEQLADALRVSGLEFPSETTGGRWARMARRGELN